MGKLKKYMGRYSYSNWESHFAWLPKKTINGQWIWFKTIYRREYLFKPLYVTGKEYATAFDLIKYS
jgi:hypothetical protein